MLTSCSLASSLRKRDMNCERDCTVLPLSTAHFFVFIIGVSPTAFNSTSTIKMKENKTESYSTLLQRRLAQANLNLNLQWNFWEGAVTDA